MKQEGKKQWEISGKNNVRREKILYILQKLQHFSIIQRITIYRILFKSYKLAFIIL